VSSSICCSNCPSIATSCQLLAAFGRRQQEQDRVQIAFLRHDAIFTQVVRENGRRDAKLGVTGFRINTRRGQQQLAGIDKILLAGIAFKTVPFRAWLKAEETTLAGDGRCRVILPRTPATTGGIKV
jgi:hypothetical protein